MTILAPTRRALKVFAVILVAGFVFLQALAQWRAYSEYRVMRTRSFLAEVKSDLRNLVTAEEAFFGDSTRYSNSLRSLQFSPSPGVSITFVTFKGASWSVTATHANLPGYVCALFVGDVPPPVGPQGEGEPVCFLR